MRPSLESLLLVPLLAASAWQSLAAVDQVLSAASSAFMIAEKSSPAPPSAAKAS
jgi:hypothetical protein